MSLGVFLAGVRRDANYALRVLRRAPGFAIVAIATLALGIGASTTIFTIVDGVLLRPLRFAEPDRLVMLRPSAGSRVSTAYFHEWRLQSRSVEDMAAWHDVRANLTGGPEPLEVLIDQTTSNYFDVFGTPPLLGRTFTVSAQDLGRAEPEAVLSYGFWQRRFGGAPDVIGRTITLDDEVYTVIGVMPADFRVRTTELAESRAELWTPYALMPGDPTGMGGTEHVVARVRSGVTLEQAQTEISLIAQAIETANPSYSREWRAELLPLLDATVRDVRPMLVMLFGAVGILLLIACANVANLLLGRSAARQAELEIRRSLGATRAALVRLALTESLLLAAIGGVLGVLLAAWGTGVLVSSMPEGLGMPRRTDLAVDLRVLSFAVAVTVLTAILFGLAPALRFGRPLTGKRPGPNPLSGALIVSEVAFALVLIAGAGLLARSFGELLRVDPGFQTEMVVTFRTTLPDARYGSDDRVRAFSRALQDRLEQMPEVLATGTVNYLPMSQFGQAGRFEIEGRPDRGVDDQKFSWISVAGGRYFDAMGIPLLRGRLPDASDSSESPPVFVIDEQFARQYFPDGDPIGARLIWPMGDDRTRVGEIVGVVGNVRWLAMAAAPPATAYWWFPNAPNRELTIVVRTSNPSGPMAARLAAQVREIDPNQPVSDVRSMETVVAANLARPRFTLLLLAGFAAMALLLAGVGLYGVVAGAVAQRTREIGVRVALGAQYVDVVRLVMRRGATLVGLGLAIGVASSLALGRFVSSLLYEITPRDPLTLFGAATFLALVALVAAFIPARRAARLDPTVALRTE